MSAAGPRVLLVTPDYPPDRGGIQYLLHGLVRHATRVRFRVVAVGDGPRETDEDGIPTCRLRARGARGRTIARASMIARLNAVALAEARRWHPDVVLSGHIVAAPAAGLTGLPFVQYLYANEVAHRPRLASFAVRHASASIVLGEHGRSLALGAGADPGRIRVIPPGIDLPPRPATSPRGGRR